MSLTLCLSFLREAKIKQSLARFFVTQPGFFYKRGKKAEERKKPSPKNLSLTLNREDPFKKRLTLREIAVGNSIVKL